MHEYEYVFLECMKSLNYDIIFIFNDPRFVAPPRLKRSCKAVLTRPNSGFDWGAWHWALYSEKVDTSAYNRILFINNSFVAPLFGKQQLHDTIERMNRAGYDAWGMTESDELEWHIQSYWISFSRAVVESSDFESIFPPDVESMTTLQEAVYTCEVKFASRLRELGFSVGVAFPKLEDYDTNPYLFHWESLLSRGFPLLKIKTIPRYANCKTLLNKYKCQYKYPVPEPRPKKAAPKKPPPPRKRKKKARKHTAPRRLLTRRLVKPAKPAIRRLVKRR